jgi:hypothetical protein
MVGYTLTSRDMPRVDAASRRVPFHTVHIRVTRRDAASTLPESGILLVLQATFSQRSQDTSMKIKMRSNARASDSELD